MPETIHTAALEAKSDRSDSIDEARSFAFTVRDGEGSAWLRLHALDWGDALQAPLLFLHGGGANARWWEHVAHAFVGAWRVVALDSRGHGESPHTPGRYTLEILTRDVEAVIDQIGGRAAIVGASMGGVIGLLVAARSERVERIVVIDSPLRPPADAAARRARLARPKLYPSREEAIARFRLMPPETLANPALLRRIAEHSVRPTSDGGWTLKYDSSLFASAPQGSFEHVLPRVGCPVLFMRGEHSVVVDEATARWTTGGIPHARLVTVAGAYHHLFLDRPQEFVALARAFLDEGS